MKTECSEQQSHRALKLKSHYSSHVHVVTEFTLKKSQI